MCGIAGFVSNRHEDDSKLKQMTSLLAKRGPDDFGGFCVGNVGLGHRRLSIIDLSTGHQPMFSEDKTVVIVFNGEIYNYQRIREGLIEEGFTFITESDTEVIIKGYQAYGLKGILNKLEGMFAFALFDDRSGSVFLARDRFGEKPLFYFQDEAGFYFASELKALVPFVPEKTIDKEALNLYLTLTYIPAPYTIYKDVRKLLPGNFIEVKSTREIRFIEYYSLKDVIESTKPYNKYEDAKRKLRTSLFQSVKDRMVADVPLGSFLSGGIDSSIISAIMAKQSAEPINTFSIGFKEKSYDESDRAAIVAKHINANHTLHVIDHNDLLEIADEVVEYFDEPFGDSSALPSFIVAKKAREKVTVVLTGDCADELFGGYEKYLAPYYVKKYNTLPGFLKSLMSKVVATVPHTAVTNSFLRKIKKVLLNARLDALDLHYNFMSLGFNDDERKLLLKPEFIRNVKALVKERYDAVRNLSVMDKGFYADVTTVLEGDMLVKVDRMCMANSLEARVPFLDSQIVKQSFMMPTSFKIQGTNKKRILKDTFKDLLPAKVFQFSKKGFGVPIALWFRNELRSELESVVSPDLVARQRIFDPEQVQNLVNEHMNGKENHASKLWCLFVFQKWYNKNISVASEKIGVGGNSTR
jgi:asparagine synthase (glutamine-hydrolysing)